MPDSPVPPLHQVSGRDVEVAAATDPRSARRPATLTLVYTGALLVVAAGGSRNLAAIGAAWLRSSPLAWACWWPSPFSRP